MASPRTHPRRSLRLALAAAAMGVAGCFAAAFTLSDQPAQAAEVAQPR